MILDNECCKTINEIPKLPFQEMYAQVSPLEMFDLISRSGLAFMEKLAQTDVANAKLWKQAAKDWARWHRLQRRQDLSAATSLSRQQKNDQRAIISDFKLDDLYPPRPSLRPSAKKTGPKV